MAAAENNPVLGACDILVKWIDEEFREHGLPLNQNALNRVKKFSFLLL
jgi:hypothetical protein